MSDKYFVLVAGNGESSRANTEALMEDHYYAKGADGTLVLSYEKQPTKSQIFAAQYAKENNKELMVFCHEDAQTTGIPGASQSASNQPTQDAVAFLKDQDATAFLLWAEDDVDVLAACMGAGIPAFNLCDGLVPLNEISAPKPPKIIGVVKEPVEQMEFDLIGSIEAIHKELGKLLTKAKSSK